MKKLSDKRLEYLYSTDNLKKLEKLRKLNTKKVQNVNTDSFDFGYVLGSILGDGNIRRYDIRLKCIDKDFSLNFKNSLEKCFNLNSVIRTISPKTPNRQTLFDVELYSINASKFIKDFNKNKILELSKKVKIGFLRGIFDSEGSAQIGYYKSNNSFQFLRTVEIYNKNIKLLKICKVLLNQLNIRTRKITKSTRCYRLTLKNNKNNFKKFIDIIGFSIKRKQDKLNSIVNSYSESFKPWKKKEILFLKNNYKILEDKIIAQKLRRSRYSVYMKRKRMKLIKR